MSEIHLNRRGINAIDVPGEVEAAPGSDLSLRIVNHGSPLHISLATTNSVAYTDFIHENLYVDTDAEFHIPIREDAPPGIFSVEVIAGYGARRATFKVIVREHIAPAPEPISAPPRPAPPTAFTGLHLALKLPPLPVLAPVAAALVLYILWIASGIDLLNVAAFVALLVGVILAWLRQRS